MTPKGKTLVVVECGASRGSSRCGELVATVRATDQGPMLAYYRVGPEAAAAPVPTRSADAVSQMTVTGPPEDPPPRVREILRDVSFFDPSWFVDHPLRRGKHPAEYDGMWCPNHRLRKIAHVELVKVLRRNIGTCQVVRANA